MSVSFGKFTPRPRRPARAAFTLVEVMTACTVLFLALAGTLVAVKTSLERLKQSRHTDAASQLMQSELERLRLRSWDQLQALQASGDTTVKSDVPSAFAVRCTRRIVDLRDGLKEITVEATWEGPRGRAQTARLVTRYARSGLNDYVYTSR